MKILLTVDGSDYSRRMLGWLAAHEAFAQGAEYTLATFVPPLPVHVTRHLDREVIDGYCRDRAGEVLEPLVEFARRHGWTFRSEWSIGHPAERIAEAASRHDLVVMGSQGHSAVGALVLGSVTQRVLASCATPVLIVR